MKKSLRFISILIAAVFLISGAMMVVTHADENEEGGNAGVVDEQGGNEQGGNEQGGNEQGGNEQGGNEQGGNEQGGNEQGGNEQGGNEQGGNEQGADHGGSGEQSGDSDQGSNDSGNEGNYSVDYDPEPMYYGEASNYDYNMSDSPEATAGSVSSHTTLYNTSGMSAADAAPNEWSDIVLDEKTVKTGVADFSAIKSNTETQDNGDWILYLGYVLIGLSALGIIYFIIATVTHRKAMQKAERLERRRASSPARSEAARMEARERRASGAPSRRTSRFADEAPNYSRRASSKADTGEVYVPRRVAKKTR